jgi:hypothetical protein
MEFYQNSILNWFDPILWDEFFESEAYQSIPPAQPEGISREAESLPSDYTVRVPFKTNQPKQTEPSIPVSEPIDPSKSAFDLLQKYHDFIQANGEKPSEYIEDRILQAMQAYADQRDQYWRDRIQTAYDKMDKDGTFRNAKIVLTKLLKPLKRNHEPLPNV